MPRVVHRNVDRAFLPACTANSTGWCVHHATAQKAQCKSGHNTLTTQRKATVAAYRSCSDADLTCTTGEMITPRVSAFREEWGFAGGDCLTGSDTGFGNRRGRDGAESSNLSFPCLGRASSSSLSALLKDRPAVRPPANRCTPTKTPIKVGVWRKRKNCRSQT